MISSQADRMTPGKRALIIGLGGAGCNALSHLAAERENDAGMLAINTDVQTLAASGLSNTLQIGKKLTRGRSAGGDRTTGRKALEENEEELLPYLRDQDVVFIITGLGGGTGSGAAPVIARKARELGAASICFVSMPFSFEGDRPKAIARDGLLELRRNADLVVTLYNDDLLEITGEDSEMKTAFAMCDHMLGVEVEALLGMLSQPGVINIDMATLKGMAKRTGGDCRFAFGEGEGTDKAQHAVEQLFDNPTFANEHVRGEAGAVLVNMCGGSDLTLGEARYIMNAVSKFMRPGIEVEWGSMIDDAWLGRIAVTALAFRQVRVEESAKEITESSQPAGESKMQESTAKRTRQRRRTSRSKQPTLLPNDYTDKGRFKGVEPTLHDGQDLDLPTFSRRGIKLTSSS